MDKNKFSQLGRKSRCGGLISPRYLKNYKKIGFSTKTFENKNEFCVHSRDIETQILFEKMNEDEEEKLVDFVESLSFLMKNHSKHN